MFAKVFVGLVAAAGLAGAGISLAPKTTQAGGSCCYPGSPCCGGASCCYEGSPCCTAGAACCDK